MFEKVLTVILTIFFIGVMALGIVLGANVKSFWVGAMAFIGTLLSLSNVTTLGEDKGVKVNFYILHVLSVALVCGAAWIADLRPQWIVIILVSFTTLPALFASDSAFKESTKKGIGVTFFTLLTPLLGIALPAFLGNLSGKQTLPAETWAWSLAISAIAVMAIGMMQAASYDTGHYFACVGLGVLPLIGLAILIGFNSSWVWMLPWLISAVLVGIGGLIIPTYITKTGLIGLILALLIGLAGVGQFLVHAAVLPNPFAQEQSAEATATQVSLPDHQQTQAAVEAFSPTSTRTPRPTAEAVLPEGEMESGIKGPGFFPAIGTFLWQAIKSIWGILYLLVVISIGQVWFKRGGGFIFFLLLVLAAGYFGGQSAKTLALFVNLITTGPATWWAHILYAFQNWTGSTGWGILATAAGVTLLLLPALKITNQYSRKALTAQQQGTNAVQQFITSDALGCREMTATYLYLLGSSAIPISLWVALRRLSTLPGRALPFLIIPNLAVPHWRPIWHFSYFVVGGLFLLAYVLYMQMMQKNQPENPFTKIGIWAVLPVSFVMCILVPSGVLLYMAAQLILMAGLIPLVSPAPQKTSYVTQPPAPSHNIPAQDDDFNQYLDAILGNVKETTPEKDIWADSGQDSGPSSADEHLSGNALTTLSSALVGGYLPTGSQLLGLDERGKAFQLYGSQRQSDLNLHLDSPISLLVGKADQLFAVGKQGTVIPLETSPSLAAGDRFELSSPVRLAEVNPSGTLLAYVPKGAPNKIEGFFLGVSREQSLVSLDTEPITCMAFSKNARYLGVGTQLGRLLVVDIATRQINEIAPDPGFGSPLFLAATDNGHWVCVYRGGWVTRRDMEGHQQGPVELSNQPTSLAIEPDRSRILVGDQSGYLWCYSPDLRELSTSLHIQDQAITQIFVAADGTVITAGDRQILRKTTI